MAFYGYGRRDSVVGIATGHGLNVPGFLSRKGKEIFSSPKPSRPALGPAQPPIECTGVGSRG
jgi:hypothetical protein